MTLIVGAHPQNPSLSILARRRDAAAALREKGLAFFVYGAGSQTIPLIQAGVLHLAGTGATPPILTKAAGLSTAVFAIGESRPERGGLLVAEESEFRSLSDLRGRGIGLMPVSWHTQFLAAELESKGLAWSDVRAAEIIPATAKDAFLAGHLDAIVATDPLYSSIVASRPVRILAKPGGAFSNRTVFWGPTEVLRTRLGRSKGIDQRARRLRRGDTGGAGRGGHAPRRRQRPHGCAVATRSRRAAMGHLRTRSRLPDGAAGACRLVRKVRADPSPHRHR
ncbi:ABC transporter substrate-binding protein (plasmid) [Methylobacterium sp. NMS12]|uniref:ABC transporter substrate-binding protein n=1 Tax=Methylobacterium sp. NMS12 TaxID=3079766 RepID=UPI003F882F9A